MDTESKDAKMVGARSVQLALDLLEALAAAAGPLGLSALVARVGAPRPTVHRLLLALQSRGYVTQETRGEGYSIGIRCFELGSLWAQNLDLRAVAAPHLAWLNVEADETVHLAVYDQGDAVYVEKLDSSQPIVPKSFVGRRCPGFCVATGRILLAFQPAEVVERVLAQPLPVFTPQSVTDPAELRAMFDRARADGYAVNHGSLRLEVGGLAAPIRDHTGSVVAAVGLCLPEIRFGAERFPLLRDRTITAAARISIAMGAPKAWFSQLGESAETQVG